MEMLQFSPHQTLNTHEFQISGLVLHATCDVVFLALEVNIDIPYADSPKLYIYMEPPGSVTLKGIMMYIIIQNMFDKC